MAAIYHNLQRLASGRTHFSWRQFVREHITRSWLLALWLLVLTTITVAFTVNQLRALPLSTILVLLLWGVSVLWAVSSELARHHTSVSYWLKNNLYNSITNVLLTLLLMLAIVAAARGMLLYMVVNASFSTDPVIASQEAAGGAIWGAVIDNFRLLAIFRFPAELDWRIYATIGMLVVLTVPSLFVYRDSFKGSKYVRRGLTYLWLLTPVISYLFLRGVGEAGPLQQVNPDQVWGGLLLTLILSVFSIVVSFPIGLLLALGRRSQITGVPAWLTYTIALAVMVWGLVATTPGNLAAARSNLERVLAFWPLLLPVVAYFFQRSFKGNLVAAFSVLYIEAVRGVPLITVLFMATVMFPLILPPNTEILNTWRVLGGFTLFSAAYLAENVRGGLQSLSKGQYEAADALGLSTFNKYRLVILPQALRAVIPAILGQFISLFKDTSLVQIVGLFDILNVAGTITSQTKWLGRRAEPYIFIAVVYFIGSAAMTAYSRRLEKRLGVGQR